MSAPLPKRNILVLTAAALTGGLFALHGLLQSPWDLMTTGAPMAAVGSWMFAPCLLAAAATTIGAVEPTTSRSTSSVTFVSVGLAVVLPMVVVTVMGLVFEPTPVRTAGWIGEVLPVALFVGVGCALCSLFWQGVVQLHLGKSWPALLRVSMVSALAAVIWVPFWIGTESARVDGGPIWMGLVAVSATAAVIHETGMSTRFVVVLTGLTGVGITWMHQVPFA